MTLQLNHKTLYMHVLVESLVLLLCAYFSIILLIADHIFPQHYVIICNLNISYNGLNVFLCKHQHGKFSYFIVIWYLICHEFAKLLYTMHWLRKNGYTLFENSVWRSLELYPTDDIICDVIAWRSVSM